MDVVVTVPATRWRAWLAEGDAAGAPPTGQRYAFSVPSCPTILNGERVYVVAHGRLRGYAPLVNIVWHRDTRIDLDDDGDSIRYALERAGGAVAVTIDQPIRGFQGYRYRWWDRAAERPFPDWQTP